MKPKDIRILRTERAIRDAFICLVGERGYAAVTVKDICERADVNRNTFYLHYRDKESLMKRLLECVIAEQAKPVADVVSRFSAISEDMVEQTVRNLLAVMEREMPFYRILFTDDALCGYVRYLHRTARSMILAGASRPVSPVALDYMISGFIGVVTEWVAHEDVSIDAVAPQLARMVTADLQLFHASDAGGKA